MGDAGQFDAAERLKLMSTLRHVFASDFAGWDTVCTLHAEGSFALQKLMLLAEAPSEMYKLVHRSLGGRAHVAPGRQLPTLDLYIQELYALGTGAMKQGNLEKAIDRMARECVANQLRMLSRVITGIYEDELRPLRLKVSQMVILAVTEKRGPIRASELSQILQVDASTLSRNLERMRARGWLENVAGRNERSRPLKLTDKGRKVLTQAVSAWERAQAAAQELIGKEGVAALRRLTKQVRGRAKAA